MSFRLFYQTKSAKNFFFKYIFGHSSLQAAMFFFIFIIRHQSYAPELADLLFRLIRTYLNIAL